jgi:subtilisin family serine protease
LLPALAGPAQAAAAVPRELSERAQRDGRVRVLVRLAVPPEATAGHAPEAAERRRGSIRAAQAGVLARLPGGAEGLRRRLRTVPYMAMEVDVAGLAALAADPDVADVRADPLLRPLLAQSGPLIEADVAWDAGYDGSGQVVAVVDSGVDKTHPFLAGKVVAEACFASNRGCPNGADTQVGAGAAEPCPFDPFACLHGTHVAGIAAGAGSSFSGVARGASILAIQVFHPSTECIPFFEPVPCARAFSSDVSAALEHVYDSRATHPVAAVNLSLGGGSFASACDAFEPTFTAVVENLRAAGIATVAASGNAGDVDAMSFPACVSSTVSVGATTKDDDVAWFSNVAPGLSLFAPGASIVSSVPGGFIDLDGTSMAAPHVAGAWAVLRQARPEASVAEVLAQLRESGRPVVDQRGGTGTTVPRIALAGALDIQWPVPVLTSVSPAALQAWRPATTLTVTGADFVRRSVVQVNGVARPTTYAGPTALTVQVPATDLATTASSLSLRVVTPQPGGGASDVLTVPLTQPQLAVSAARITGGRTVTVTLTDGAGGPSDWLAVAPEGAPATTYAQWTYVGAGLSTRSWTVTLATAGRFEFRLFHANGFTRMATSPVVLVDPPLPPTLAVSTTTAAPGGQVTVTVTDAPGGFGDWLGLAAAGSPDTSYVLWTFMGSGVTTRTWTVTLPAAGTYQFRLFASGVRVATSPTITAVAAFPPVLTVSASSVALGTTVTATLSNAPGGAQDWLALATVGAPDASYLQWTWVGAGQTTRTWTVTLANPGVYEFRLFAGNVKAAVSGPVTAASSARLAVSATAVAVGAPVTVTLTDGHGGASDWLALAVAGSPDTSYLAWTYVGGGVRSRSWTVTPASPGTYEFRLFLNNGFTRAATSPPVTAGP